jgi:predicted nucleic acid-binding protein
VALLRATHLVDKSALARMTHPAVEARLRPLLEEGFVATFAIIDLEVLYSARSLATYDAILAERQALDEVPITAEVASRAISVQRLLAEVGRHRLPIADLLIAAAAESAGLTVLHYDADFERIAEITGQEHEWVVPRGSL